MEYEIIFRYDKISIKGKNYKRNIILNLFLIAFNLIQFAPPSVQPIYFVA